MIQVKNLRILENVPFEEYLALPGYSHSIIRANGKDIKPATPKMLLGSAVDAYLTDSANYNYDNVSLIRPIALQVKKTVGGLYKYLKPQLAFTCNFIYGGFNLLYKGRADGAIIERIVLDYKVSKMPLMKGVEFFGYDNQLSGYALALGCKVAIIISQHPEKLQQTSIYNVPISSDWWEQQIIKFGEPIL